MSKRAFSDTIKSPAALAVVAVLVTAVVAVSGMALVGCGNGQKAGFPDAPDEAVRHVATQLHDQHPEVLWEALPPSYRQDISELVHGYAAKLDADLYNKAFGLIGKAVEILKTKKDIILGSKVLAGFVADNREEVSLHWDGAIALVETVVTSDLSSLERLQTIDIGAFLAGTGTQLMQQAADASKMLEDDPYSSEVGTKLSQVQVELVSVEGDTAVLRISAPDEETQELQMVRVEDRWVPKEIADDWQKNMTEAREQLAKLDESKTAAAKMQAVLAMGMMEAFLDQIAQATTSEELDAVIGGMFGNAMRAAADRSQDADTDDGPGTSDSMENGSMENGSNETSSK